MEVKFKLHIPTTGGEAAKADTTPLPGAGPKIPSHRDYSGETGDRGPDGGCGCRRDV